MCIRWILWLSPVLFSKTKVPPPKFQSNQWYFQTDSLAPKRYWLTPHNIFRFMKDIKDAEITFAPVRIRLLQFDEFFRGWVSVAALWSLSLLLLFWYAAGVPPYSVRHSRAYFSLYVTHPHSPWFYSLFLFRQNDVVNVSATIFNMALLESLLRLRTKLPYYWLLVSAALQAAAAPNLWSLFWFTKNATCYV